MRRLALALGVLGAALGVLAAPAGAANQFVSVRDDVFVQNRVAVKPGESVTWTNPGPPGGTRNPHNVDFDDGLFTEPQDPSTFWNPRTRMFPTAGTYLYHCHQHGAPGGVGMSGVVFVNAIGDLPPIATLSVYPNPVATGETVHFDATSSSDSDGIAKFEWDLDGDGSFEKDTGRIPTTSQSYTSPVTLIAKVRVTDNQGISDVRTRLLQINAPASPPASVGAPNFVTPAAMADRTAPLVSDYGVTNKAFQVAKASTPTSGKAAKKTGTTFRYKLSEAATVKIDVQALLPGRKKGQACVKSSSKLKKAKKCVRIVSQGTLTRTSHVGANAVAFSGRVGSRRLKPGSYQAVLTAADAAGNASGKKTVAFKVIRG